MKLKDLLIESSYSMDKIKLLVRDIEREISEYRRKYPKSRPPIVRLEENPGTGYYGARRAYGVYIEPEMSSSDTKEIIDTINKLCRRYNVVVSKPEYGRARTLVAFGQYTNESSIKEAAKTTKKRTKLPNGITVTHEKIATENNARHYLEFKCEGASEEASKQFLRQMQATIVNQSKRRQAYINSSHDKKNRIFTMKITNMPNTPQADRIIQGYIAIAKNIKESVHESERDYKEEYKKYQSSPKMKKYRAELNKYNRDKGTYGNGDGKDASHKGGKIAGFESESKNRGRREKSRKKGSKRK